MCPKAEGLLIAGNCGAPSASVPFPCLILHRSQMGRSKGGGAEVAPGRRRRCFGILSQTAEVGPSEVDALRVSAGGGRVYNPAKSSHQFLHPPNVFTIRVTSTRDAINPSICGAYRR